MRLIDALVVACALPAAPDPNARAEIMRRSAVQCFLAASVAYGPRSQGIAACGRNMRCLAPSFWSGFAGREYFPAIGSGNRARLPKGCLATNRMSGSFGDIHDGMTDEEIMKQMTFFSAASLLTSSDEIGYKVRWDGHDATVSQVFRSKSAQLGLHVSWMIDSRQEARMRALLLKFGEPPSEKASVEEMGEKVLRLAFLSAGLRRTLEDEILGIDTSGGVPRRGIVRDEPLEGMRATVQRRTPRNPGARSTPRVVSSLRNEGQEEQRAIGGDAMGALEGAPEEQMMRRTVAELKQMCEVRGLKKSGRKADIVRRLIEGT